MNGIKHINPAGLPAMGYTNVIVVPATMQTIYIGGQNAVNAKGEIVGVGDFAAQTRQVMDNIELALSSAGASLENVIKWNVYMVEGNDVNEGFAVFQERWGKRPNPPAVSGLFVSGLARPEFLLEIEAVAVIPESTK